jgi:hypothetical protein
MGKPRSRQLVDTSSQPVEAQTLALVDRETLDVIVEGKRIRVRIRDITPRKTRSHTAIDPGNR